VGTQGGSQDHTAILCSRAGTLSQYRWVPVQFERTVRFPADYTMAIAVSGVAAAKGAGALTHYNRLSADASELLRIWQERSGQDDPTLLGALGSAPEAFERLSGWLEDHPCRDTLRARAAQFRDECLELIPGVGHALARGDLDTLGRLVDRSQLGAERGLGNQVPETIHLQRSGRSLGAVAASAFGAGFGGSVWAMVPKATAEEFVARWSMAYKAVFPAAAERARFLTTSPGDAAESTMLEPS
jgi:galactokinase